MTNPGADTNLEARRRIRRDTGGMPMPRIGAPKEEWRAWYVAAMFFIYMRESPNDPALAKKMAADDIRSQEDAANYEPFVQKALGQTGATSRAKKEAAA